MLQMCSFCIFKTAPGGAHRGPPAPALQTSSCPLPSVCGRDVSVVLTWSAICPCSRSNSTPSDAEAALLTADTSRL
ncbi:hypothetical protein EVAR_9833_1 [Eumeta japonica]|uniref:Uncharacterized protein n=1 Tax=Eumeta variegata TaxID=151549 RepID=A0A4C1U6B6_EUMVA|nr:hypothetical protein EVAR_9833_1 [Eumeta japonica]